MDAEKVGLLNTGDVFTVVPGIWDKDWVCVQDERGEVTGFSLSVLAAGPRAGSACLERVEAFTMKSPLPDAQIETLLRSLRDRSPRVLTGVFTTISPDAFDAAIAEHKNNFSLDLSSAAFAEMTVRPLMTTWLQMSSNC